MRTLNLSLDIEVNLFLTQDNLWLYLLNFYREKLFYYDYR